MACLSQLRRPTGAAAATGATPSLRVAILVGELADRCRDYLVQIKHELSEAGHILFFTPWFMPELGMDVRSIAGRLKRTEADAWIAVSAARPLLEWFVAQEVWVFALCGRRRGLPVAGAGPDKPPAIGRATRRLIAVSAEPGLRVPEDVSLICADGDPHFAWCRPSVAHIHSDIVPVVRRAVRWTANLARGKPDVGQTMTKSEFIEGGTIGPPPFLH